MTLRSLTFVALLGGMLALPPAAVAGPPDGFGPPGRGFAGDGDAPGMVIPLLLRGTDLSDAQREQVKAVMRANKQQLRELFRELRAANDALAARLVDPQPVDAAALKEDVARVAAAREALMQRGVETVVALRAILTPEQLATLAKKRARLHELQQEMRKVWRE